MLLNCDKPFEKSVGYLKTTGVKLTFNKFIQTDGF